MTTNKGFNRPLNTGHDVWLSARVHFDFCRDSIPMGKYTPEFKTLPHIAGEGYIALECTYMILILNQENEASKEI